ncbi:hypothetical protein AB0M48_22730 [Lentzea sp. NPDC051208]|uniref:hypothetical protein n=1 Tax=Lentzea sp. NPDC051208 TaxID=3154642 RepID=UPI003425230A
MTNWTIHIEKSRTLLGNFRTLCGRTITNVKVSGPALTVTCPRCKAAEKGGR